MAVALFQRGSYKLRCGVVWLALDMQSYPFPVIAVWPRLTRGRSHWQLHGDLTAMGNAVRQACVFSELRGDASLGFDHGLIRSLGSAYISCMMYVWTNVGQVRKNLCSDTVSCLWICKWLEVNYGQQREEPRLGWENQGWLGESKTRAVMECNVPFALAFLLNFKT